MFNKYMEVTIGNVNLQFPCLRHFSSTLLNFASVIDFAIASHNNFEMQG